MEPTVRSGRTTCCLWRGKTYLAEAMAGDRGSIGVLDERPRSRVLARVQMRNFAIL